MCYVDVDSAAGVYVYDVCDGNGSVVIDGVVDIHDTGVVAVGGMHVVTVDSAVDCIIVRVDVDNDVDVVGGCAVDGDNAGYGDVDITAGGCVDGCDGCVAVGIVVVVTYAVERFGVRGVAAVDGDDGMYVNAVVCGVCGVACVYICVLMSRIGLLAMSVRLRVVWLLMLVVLFVSLLFMMLFVMMMVLLRMWLVIVMSLLIL